MNKIFGFSFLLFSLFSSKSFSQNEAKVDTTIDFEEVVISGSRFEQLLKESPQNIEIIDKKQIAFQNAGNSALLLEQSGNVFVQKSQAGGGSPVLRGFEANKVLIVIDGVRMNNAIFRGGHLQNVLRIDQNMLERLEVVFGPSSVNYGSDAFGGVMHFRTKDPKFDTKNANAYARYGAVNQEKTIHLDFNLGFEEVSFLSSFTLSDFNDLRMGKNYRNGYEGFGQRPFYLQHNGREDELVTNQNPYLQSESGYSQADFLQKVKIKTGAISHIFNFQGSISSDVPRYDRLTELDNDGNLRFGDWFYGPELRSLFSYNVSLPETKWYGKANIIAAAQLVRESRNTRLRNEIQKKQQRENVGVYSLNADFQKKFKSHSIQYGVELIRNNVSSHARFLSLGSSYAPLGKADTRYPDGGSFTNSVGIYASDHYKVNEKVLLNAGLRYTYAALEASFEDKTFFPFEFDKVRQENQALVGNLGLIVFPTDKSRFKTLVSSGFRTPNIDDLAKVFDSGQGTLVVPNPDVNPEKTYNFEMGWSQKLGTVLELEATYFNTFLRDALVIDNFQLNGQATASYEGTESRVVAMQNKGQAIVNGFQLGAKVKFTDNFKLASTLNETKGQLADGTPLDHIPPLFGKTSLTFTSPKFKGELFTMYNGWKRLDEYSPNGEDNLSFATIDGSPSWWTLNIRTSYKPSEKWELQMSVENILDTNYRNFASGISAAGRNVLLTVRRAF